MNTQSARHRPTPLNASVNSAYHVPPPAQRSARSSRGPNTPTLQASQQAYLMQLQNQVAQQTALQNAMLLQQVLVQQQAEAEQVYRKMAVGAAAQQPHLNLTQQQHHGAYLGAVNSVHEDSEQVAARNPLVASALARRKRQSLNSEAAQNLSQQTQQIRFHARANSAEPNSNNLGAQGGAYQAQQTRFSRDDRQHHRRHSSGVTFSSASSSSPLKTPPATSDPPALILTQPGEEYPNTSSSGSESGDVQTKVKSARPSAATIHARNDSNSSKGSSTDSLEIITNAMKGNTINENNSRRTSHLGSLELALSARRNRTPTEKNSPLPNSALSPFANTFTPTPPCAPTSPRLEQSYENMESTWVSSKPAPAAGTATAIRQPKGPAAELAGNFNARLRRQALLTLTTRRSAQAVTAE